MVCYHRGALSRKLKTVQNRRPVLAKTAVANAGCCVDRSAALVMGEGGDVSRSSETCGAAKEAELNAILRHRIPRGGILGVEAAAGAGKSTMLREYARRNSGMRILYVVRNVPVADRERNVTCHNKYGRTSHHEACHTQSKRLTKPNNQPKQENNKHTTSRHPSACKYPRRSQQKRRNDVT